ncbi:MAG: hypothetical protein LBO08_01385 [Rickettsiales bacterium]|jgi:opacity protein-like surface antigen|nr:hypothetical protein [Rickettsiales bacterium]
MNKVMLMSFGAMIAAGAANAANDYGFIVSTGANVLSSTDIKMSIEGVNIAKNTSGGFNNYGGFALGYGNNKMMGGVFFARETDDTTSINEFDIGWTYALMDTQFTPYISTNIGIASINIDADVYGEEISATGFSYGIGAGVQYNLTDTSNIKVGLSYSGFSSSTKIYGFDIDIIGSAIALDTSISIKF